MIPEPVDGDPVVVVRQAVQGPNQAKRRRIHPGDVGGPDVAGVQGAAPLAAPDGQVEPHLPLVAPVHHQRAVRGLAACSRKPEGIGLPQLLDMGLDESAQTRRTDLLFALDGVQHAHRQSAAHLLHRPQGHQRRRQGPPVVGGAAPAEHRTAVVQQADAGRVEHGGIERRTGPILGDSGNHVVEAVEEQGLRVRRGRPGAPEHDRVALGLDQARLGIGETRHEVPRQLCALANSLSRLRDSGLSQITPDFVQVLFEVPVDMGVNLGNRIHVAAPSAR